MGFETIVVGNSGDADETSLQDAFIYLVSKISFWVPLVSNIHNPVFT